MYVSRLAGRVLATGLALWCGTSAAAAQLLYEQTPSGPAYNYAYWSSEYGSSAVSTADSFQLTESTLLSRITWWGIYDEQEAPPAEYESFTIRIHADNGGEPGAVLATFNTGPNEASRTATGRYQTWPEYNPDPNTAEEYTYKWTLTTPFPLEANTTYWMSIVGSVPYGNWYWSHSAHPQNLGAMQAWGDPVNGPWDQLLEPLDEVTYDVLANTAFRLDSFAPPSYATYEQPRLNGVGGATSSPTTTEWADSFVLTGASTIKRIVWWGGYGPLVNYGNTDNFTIHIYADDAGQPGAEIASYAAGAAYTWGFDGDGYLEFPSPGDPFSGIASFTHEYILPTPLAVQANTRYWVSIVNARPDESWLWQASDSAHELGLQFRDATLSGSPWTAHTAAPVHDVAFRIETAPVPPYEQRPWHMDGWGAQPYQFTSADSFVLTETMDVTRISWWGGYLGSAWYPPPGSDDFTVHIFADNGGQPGALIVTYTPGDRVFRTLTGGLADDGYPFTPPTPEFFYSMALPAPLTLQANTRYWISINTAPYPNVAFLWEGGEWNGGPGVYVSANDPLLGPWMNWGTAGLSFRLDR